MTEKPDYRAYLNPQPAFSEAEQKVVLAPYEPRAIYVESRKETRANWIGSLRPTSIALVPDAFVIAKANGRKDTRFADFLEAKDEIHERDSHILEASTGRRSDSKKDWPLMRDTAREKLGKAVKKGKVGKPALGYTDGELQSMQAVMESRNHKNWGQRAEAIRARGIKLPGRTWALSVLPRLIKQSESGIEPTPVPRKRKSYVYFIRDGDKVKIGFSVKPKDRMNALKTHSPLDMIGTVSGDRKKEAALHRKFAQYKIKGTREWFLLSPTILDYIKRSRIRR